MQIYTITYKNQVGEIKELRCTSLTIEDYKRHIIVTKGKIRCIELAHYTNHRLYSSMEYKVLRDSFLHGEISKEEYKDYKELLIIK